MILAWNIRGLNKKARYIEIGAHLKTLNVSCVALLETQVKRNNANKMRHVFGNNWKWFDNYDDHPNGRIWIMWKNDSMELIKHVCSDQFLHCEILNKTGHCVCWMTSVYAQNQLMNRMNLSKDIKNLEVNIKDRLY